MEEQDIRVLLVSESRLLIDGLRKILESEVSIDVIAGLSDFRELEEFLNKNEPDYIFFDQRVVDPKVEKFLHSKRISSMDTEVILLSNEDGEEDTPSRFIKVNQDTSAVELLDIIKNRRELQSASIKKNAFIKEYKCDVTKTESRIINLVTSGHTNKEIAEKLRISEKTVKAHITSIFSKLNIQNRYQLMVYGKRISRESN